MKSDLAAKAISEAIKGIVSSANKYDLLILALEREARKRGLRFRASETTWYFQTTEGVNLDRQEGLDRAIEFIFSWTEEVAIKHHELLKEATA